MKKKLYLAGGMRGYPLHNFPKFDEAEVALSSEWDVISPATMDRMIGFDPATSEVTDEFIQNAIRRDVDAIINQADAIAMLPGWEKSTGATAEYHLAKWKGIPIYLYPSMTLDGSEDVLQEAYRLTSRDRQSQYGPPDQDFLRTAGMWNSLFAHKMSGQFEPRDVAMAMICVKLSRETHYPKRDNRVDGAGYFRCMDICENAKQLGGQ